MYDEHPIITEYREIVHSRMPDGILLLIYFNLDDGPDAEELSNIKSKFDDIENQLSKIDCENQSSLRGQLMDLIPQMEIIYNKSLNALSEEQLEEFNKYLKKLEDYHQK